MDKRLRSPLGDRDVKPVSRADWSGEVDLHDEEALGIEALWSGPAQRRKAERLRVLTVQVEADRDERGGWVVRVVSFGKPTVPGEVIPIEPPVVLPECSPCECPVSYPGHVRCNANWTGCNARRAWERDAGRRAATVAVALLRAQCEAWARGDEVTAMKICGLRTAGEKARKAGLEQACGKVGREIAEALS